jgi:hypothetical protein
MKLPMGMELTGEILAGNELGVAVERGAGRARDAAGPGPEDEEAKDFAEQKSGDGDEGNPEEGIEFPGDEVGEELRGFLNFPGIVSPRIRFQGVE